MNKEIELVLQDIILHELGLPLSYGKDKDGFIIPSVYLVAPNVSLGTTDNLQIGIQSVYSQIVSNSNYCDMDAGVYTEFQDVVINDNLQIDLKSRNEDARLRRFEVITALHSVYSQEQQEKYGFRLFSIPSNFNNTSMAEGSATIYRFTLTLTAQYMKVYKRKPDYYDKFNVNSVIETSTNAIIENTQHFE